MGNVKAVKFSATWCAPCRALKLIWDNVVAEDEFADVEFQSVDIDDSPELAQQYGVRAVPTIAFVLNNVVVATLVGLHKEDAIRSELRNLLGA